MSRFLRVVSALIIGALLIGAIYLFGYFVPKTDAEFNVVVPHEPYVISDRAKALHGTLTVADLHSDSLLWRRNPEHRHTRGHMDFPRLQDGGVDIQIFSAVTKTPRGLNFDGNSADAPDDITLVALVQLWPIKTWSSIYERAAFQARRLQRMELNPKNKLVIARTQADMDQPEGTLIAVLATEGSHPLEGRLENIDRLYDEGYRMMGLHHFFDNELGGSLHGVKKGGLTDFGREAVQKMRDKNIIVDLAHSSNKVAREVLAMSDDPVVISHGGVASACPRTANRNFSDEILRDIGRRGGLLGVAYFQGAICDISPSGIADTILAAVNVMGEDAVALGSDFDGTVTTTLDTSELEAITQALLDKGASETLIRKVMGGNVERFLRENLPE